MMSDNKGLYPVSIVGIGSCLPDTVVTNDDISKIVDTSDEWIVSRTGIKQRRIVSGDETAVSLAVKAANDALAYAGLVAEDLDLIITATSLPDALYPSASCEIQKAIGANKCTAFDIVAACSGFVYGINVARSFIMSGIYKKVLLIGVDIHSRFLDWNDRSTCVLFGDGAGAVIMQRSEDGIDDILAVDLHADGTKANELRIPLKTQNCPLVQPKTEEKEQFVHMNGKEIYKFAISVVPESIIQALNLAGLTVEDLDYFVPHQANIRIVSAITDRIKLDPAKVVVNLDKYGNTSTASIPVALADALRENKIKDSSIMALSGFGAGLTWGTALVRWRAKDKRTMGLN